MHNPDNEDVTFDVAGLSVVRMRVDMLLGRQRELLSKIAPPRALGEISLHQCLQSTP
jgi:hypothetical protein